MTIKIGEVIRRLRKQSDITQEKLAEYLGISYQAVSKWENGTALPDITIIPAIANFFCVSIDQLFATNMKTRDDKEIQYDIKYDKLSNIGDVEGRIMLMREALKEYPRNFNFMINLANSLTIYCSNKQQENEVINNYILEAVNLCERVLEDCTIDNIRHSATQILCKIYPKVKRSDKALELANSMSSIIHSKEKLLEDIYTGDKKIEQIQKNILLHVNLIADSLVKLSFDKQIGEGLSYEQKLKYIEAVNNLYKVIFYDENYLFYHSCLAWNYRRLAELLCALDEKQKSIECLKTAAEHADKYDNLPQSKKYSSLLVNRCEYIKENVTKEWMGTECGMLYYRMAESVFDKIRYLGEFKLLHQELFNKKTEIKI